MGSQRQAVDSRVSHERLHYPILRNTILLPPASLFVIAHPFAEVMALACLSTN